MAAITPFSENAVEPIERGYAIRFGHGRIVERRIDEVEERIGLAFLGHDGLSDVYDFAGIVAETMHTEQFERLAMK